MTTTFKIFLAGAAALVAAVAIFGIGNRPGTPPAQVVQAVAPVADGCDLAGAIENCKAVMAELAAKGIKGEGRPLDAAPPQPKAPEQAAAAAPVVDSPRATAPERQPDIADRQIEVAPKRMR
jgi:hypothetical protein